MNKNDITIAIRPYLPEDKDSVIDLLRLNTPEYFAPEEEADLVHYLDQEIDYYYVIEYDGVLVGCGGINLNEDKTVARISWDILHPEYQGKSLGAQLLQHRIAVLQQEASVDRIIVRTSQLAFGFYGKQGFELLKVVPDYWAKGFDLYLMEYHRSDRKKM